MLSDELWCHYCDSKFDTSDSITFSACGCRYHFCCLQVDDIVREASVRDSFCHKCLKVCGRIFKGKECRYPVCPFNHDTLAGAFSRAVNPPSQNCHPRSRRIITALGAKISEDFLNAQEQALLVEPYIEQVSRLLAEAVARLFPQAIVGLCGSRAVGLCIPSSNINFFIAFPDELASKPDYMESAMTKICTALSGEDWLRDPLPTTFATKHEIKSTCTSLGLDLELSLCSTSQMHILLTRDEIMTQCMGNLYAMAPIVIHLKAVLRARQLNNSWLLSSMSIAIFVATYLRFICDISPRNNGCLGMIFLRLATFHSELNYGDLAISLYSGYCERPEHASALFVQDPVELELPDIHSRNIAKATVSVEPCREAFKEFTDGVLLPVGKPEKIFKGPWVISTVVKEHPP